MRQSIKKAVAKLQKGGIIAFPTDTVYGLACLANNPSAISKISKLKQRPEEKNYIIQIHNFQLLNNLINPESKNLIEIVKKYWPGKITFIFPANKNWSMPKIAIRIPNHPVALDILEKINQPLIVTSLNISGAPPAVQFKDIPPELLKQIDIVLKDPFGINSPLPSTLVDLTTIPFNILRKGETLFP